MSAQSFDTFVLAFSDPALDDPYPQRARVDVDPAFELFDDSHIQTLSSNNGGGDIEGLLYVPTLLPSDPCVDTSAAYVPNNVTQLSDLPSAEYLYVAFAPWISAACTLSYLAAARGATAFMTYIPDNGTTTPPPVNSETWDLKDGGRWKAQNMFPVYAIPGSEGAAIMQQLAQYSGNSSSPLDQNILAALGFDPTDYVRVYITFGTNGASNMPTLWAFLLIVLGIVLALIGMTSLLMHYFQRRHRRALQRRIENGEVDLETLGIKRSTRIPQEEVDKIPTYTYEPNNEIPREGPDRWPEPESSLEPSKTKPPQRNHTFYSQSSCAVCLEDFVPTVTKVRSLPCHHIYHPQCIDLHLTSRSSRCPVCMAHVLPKKNEQITNAMVRAERRIRDSQRENEVTEGQAAGFLNLRRYYERGRRMFSAPSPPRQVNEPTRSQIEMSAPGARTGSSTMPTAVGRTPVEMFGAQSGESISPSANVNTRRELMRGRLNRLEGPERTLEDEEAERWASMPTWRRALGTIFPGFR